MADRRISSNRAQFIDSKVGKFSLSRAQSIVSKLKQLLVFSEETADVIIECENREFKCHQVILAASSDYFDKMFNGQLRDKSDPNVVLPGISASTFEEILQFVYTGGDTVPINFSNVCSLLRASEHFRVRDMQEKCIRFVKENRLCVRSTFDLFRFACITRKQPLIDVLSEDIVRKYRIFCRNDEFLELSFDELNVILDRWKSTTEFMSEAKLIFYSVYRWINHDLQSRRCYSGNFPHIPQFENFSSVRIMMSRDGTGSIAIQHDPTPDILDLKISEPAKPVGLDDVTETTKQNAAVNLKHLNVFVQCSEENTTRVFGLPNIGCGWNISGEITNTRVCNQNLRSVALDDDHLFCMHFPRQSSASSLNLDQSFCLYDSVCLREPFELRNPPVIFEDLALCSFENRVYAFNKSQRVLNSTTSDSSSYVSLSDEAIRRGMFKYECHLDHWFPMPAMKKEFHVCCATFTSGILLVCGSEHPYETNTLQNSIQVRAYDHRSMNWLNFADERWLWHTAATACCVNDFQPNRLFLHPRPQWVFTFDIVARRWESQTRKAVPLNRNVQYGRLISLYDRVVAMGSSSANEQPSYLTTEDLWCRGNWQVNIDHSPWNISDDLTRTAEKASGKTRGIVLDAVVFKSGSERN